MRMEKEFVYEGGGWSMDDWVFFDKLCAIYLKIEPTYKVTINVWIYIQKKKKKTISILQRCLQMQTSSIHPFILIISRVYQFISNWNFLFIDDF